MKSSTRNLILCNTLGFVAVLVVNYLANALPLNGKDTGELSDQYPNLFTPAGITFAIWGVIYTWLAVFIGYQLTALFRPALADRVEPIVDKTGWLFCLSCVCNVAWIFAWHWEQVALSVGIISIFLIVMVRLNQQIGVGHRAVNALEKWISHVPFGIYQGWLTVAVIANLTALLVHHDWRGGSLSEATWTLLLIIIAAILAIMLVFRQNNIGHGLAVAWAFLGIYLKRSEAPEAGSSTISMMALVAMVAVLVLTVTRWHRWKAY